MATLFVVATPIGNLEDLSSRAERVLSQAPVIAAESVKRTRKLLSHLGLKGKKFISCREANRKFASAQVAEALGRGQDVALVTDAGTPGVSDPGNWVVQKIAGSGHRICPIPGPSAWSSGLSVSGMPGAPCLFLGFLPAKPGPRRRLLSKAGQTGWTMVMFEAPHRLPATARDLAQMLGDRPLVVARELTKVNEEVLHTTTFDLAGTVSDRVQGEVTLVVSGQGEVQADATYAEDVGGASRGRWVVAEEMLSEGLTQGREGPSRLAKRVAKAAGVPRDEVYRRLLDLKNKLDRLPGAGSDNG
ncbi:MAG: 16S rRNA (cytidine(1402)-2'-O)-methyltransferase [Desulfarculaceae bacterium]|jgi:16S rRNA (cytidine1402-2'-O)-methyltransferase